MKKAICLVLVFLLSFSMLVSAYADTVDGASSSGLTEAEYQVIEEQSQKNKVNTIITTDGEMDDMDSFLRWLMYANEFNTVGIVLSASTWHYSGGTIIMPDGTEGPTYPHKRWLGFRWLPYYLEKYAEVYDNLIVHEPDMPTPEYLESIYKIGNIKYVGEMDEITEGSEWIKDCILNNPDGEDLLVQIWGGTNTLCRALRSITEEYQDTDDWERIYNKVSDEVVVYLITDQDTSTTGYRGYIRPNWPEMRVYYNNNTYGAVGYAKTMTDYFRKDWTDKLMEIGSPLLSEYLADGGGWDLRATNASGAIFEYSIQSPTNKYYTDPETLDPIHNYPHTTWGESENRGLANRDADGNFTQTSSWTYNFVSEGDNPAFWIAINNGLRGGLENPDWGGWSGRFKPTEGASNNEYTDASSYVAEAVIDGMAGTSARFSLQRWLEDIQYDFAARAQWTVTDNYEDANHNPLSGVMNGLDLYVAAGQEITLNGVAYDPDGDELAYSWYRYAEADTYGGTGTNKGTFQLGTTADLTYTIPADANIGDTIHLIFEVSDAESNPHMEGMKAYKRVVLTVGEGEEDSGLRLSTDAHRVGPDGYADITTEFAEPINSNTAILHYTFDTDLFEFSDFHAETGVQVISREATPDGAKVVVMVPSYNTQCYGRLAIHAKADAQLTTGWATVKVQAEYVVRDENGGKEILTATAATSFTTIKDMVEGDTNGDGIVDLIDLSNMVDWFGIDSSDSEWNSLYTFFDFNNNGEIDISDIAYVARLIK